MLIGRVARQMLSLAESPLLIAFPATTNDDILHTFHIKHNLITDEIASNLSLLATAFTSNHHDSKDTARSRRSLSTPNSSQPPKSSSQSPSQRAFIQSRYTAANLFVAAHGFVAVDNSDISLQCGDLVGVIKRQVGFGKHSCMHLSIF